MSLYEELVNHTQRNYSSRYDIYSRGGTLYELSKKEPLPYEEQIKEFKKQIKEADCVIVGGASGLSAAGGGDFYYDDTPSYRKYFGKYAKKYGFKGAFAGSFYQYSDPAEKWGYLATFLHTTQNAEIRKPYLDLDELLKGKEFFILTTNQDTQFVKLYPEEKVAQIQGDHRFFQCSRQCSDDTWDSVRPVNEMIEAMGENTAIPTDMIPRCPHCGAEAFPWVRGYGNFLQGKKYNEQYQKITDYIQKHKDEKILFLELGVGRMTPMFIQEPFWELTRALPQTHYISLNDQYDFVPEGIEDRAMAIKGDIATILENALKV
ncbi:NAD-dependent protein deacetylase of SIR2 family [Lachnospiraceae bacterium TWA4]|nr:NAD-dependent protein deacetylase of SIR2 family [Lachnospiraceae bacterium TWA4]